MSLLYKACYSSLSLCIQTEFSTQVFCLDLVLDLDILDTRKYEIFLEMQHHFLIYNKDVVMLDGRKHEIFLDNQLRNGMIFTE